VQKGQPSRGRKRGGNFEAKKSVEFVPSAPSGACAKEGSGWKGVSIEFVLSIPSRIRGRGKNKGARVQTIKASSLASWSTKSKLILDSLILPWALEGQVPRILDYGKSCVHDLTRFGPPRDVMLLRQALSK